MELVVRMGEVQIADHHDDVLTCVGLGSCIGLALIARGGDAAAMAHVMLPDSAGVPVLQPGKFADTAVPALLDLLTGRAVDAVLVGGAAMFAFGGDGAGQDIGARNEAAVRSALDVLGIHVRAAATGGSKGRTVRVHLDPVEVTVREAGCPDEVVFRSPGRTPQGLLT